MKRPLLLTIGMCVSALFGVPFSILLALAPFDVGRFSVDGSPVSGPDFLVSGGAWLAIPIVMLVAIASGLHAGERWARALAAAWWPAVFAITAIISCDEQGVVVLSVIGGVFAGAATLLYLYGSQGVRDYYASLRHRPALDGDARLMDS